MIFFHVPIALAGTGLALCNKPRCKHDKWLYLAAALGALIVDAPWGLAWLLKNLRPYVHTKGTLTSLMRIGVSHAPHEFTHSVFLWAAFALFIVVAYKGFKWRRHTYISVIFLLGAVSHIALDIITHDAQSINTYAWPLVARPQQYLSAVPHVPHDTIWPPKWFDIAGAILFTASLFAIRYYRVHHKTVQRTPASKLATQS